jgi:diguanylate cyclase (GGDEF)-like protein
MQTMMDGRLQDLLDRWRQAPRHGVLADPAAFFADHAEHLLVIESDGTRSRYAHYGAAFAQRFGADLTGQVIDVLPPEILPVDRRGMLEFEYAYARRTNRPLWRSYTAAFDGETETWQRLVLPVGEGLLVVGAYPVAEVPAPSSDDPAASLLRLVIERVPVVLDDDGTILDLAVSLRAFGETRIQLAEMELLATRDPLTGVFNRRHFDHLVSLELAHSRLMGRSFSLLALDIDHFKSVNDRRGHAAGDEALKTFAAACRVALREYDILARMGGEEFAVALPNTGPEGAAIIAGRLCRQVENTGVRTADGAVFNITVSVGVASSVPTSPDLASPDIAALLKRADEALYRAKATGRNRVVMAE